MKAMRIYSHGGPEVLTFEDIGIAPPPRGCVRVRHTAIALNFSDINVRRGGFYQKEPLAMPLIPGNGGRRNRHCIGRGGHRVEARRPRRVRGHARAVLSRQRAPMRRSATCPPTGSWRFPPASLTKSPAAFC